VFTGFARRVYKWPQFSIWRVCQTVACWALDSSSFAVFRNPHYAACPFASWAWRGIAYLGYVFDSPFFLFTAKYFLLVFFFKVHVVRTDDLHFLQFLTIPALKVHNIIYLLLLELKRFSYSTG